MRWEKIPVIPVEAVRDFSLLMPGMAIPIPADTEAMKISVNSGKLICAGQIKEIRAGNVTGSVSETHQKCSARC